jgi:hypothetical protein
MKPPTNNNKVDTTLVANTASAAIPTGVGEAKDRQISVISTADFDVVFSDNGTSTITNPVGTVLPFLARTLYTFELSPKNTHYKAITAGAATFRHWLSSRT